MILRLKEEVSKFYNILGAPFPFQILILFIILSMILLLIIQHVLPCFPVTCS